MFLMYEKQSGAQQQEKETLFAKSQKQHPLSPEKVSDAKV